ncbi:MAG: hypothetical protein KF911_13560 [Pseudomonadales bacterium]|nr:hypothetical protein [Pseudomonadales bacterium]
MTDPLAALDARFGPALRELPRRARITDRLVDKDVYRILVATLWVNVVLDPDDVGLEEDELEGLHDLINRYIADVLGAGENLSSCFRYLNGKAGEQAMRAAQLTEQHRDLLLYFASMILDPEGHRRWMAEISAQTERPGRPGR